MDLPVAQRRFTISADGTITLYGRFNDERFVTTRPATPDDLAVMSWFDEQVLHNEGSVDVSLSRWIVMKALTMLDKRQAPRGPTECLQPS